MGGTALPDFGDWGEGASYYAKHVQSACPVCLNQRDARLISPLYLEDSALPWHMQETSASTNTATFYIICF